MRRNNTTIAVFLISILALAIIASVLYPRLTEFLEKRSQSVTAADREKALGYIKTEMRGLTAQLLRDFPRDSSLINITSLFYQQCNDFDEVVVTLENGLKYHPKSFELNKTAGQAAFVVGQFEKAAVLGKNALSISAKDPEVYEDVADALMFSGDLLQAFEIIKKRIRIFGGSARSYWLLGKAQLLLKNYEKAKDSYEKAYRKDPDSKKIYFSNMAKVCIRLKQPEQAKKYMQLHKDAAAEKKAQDVEVARSRGGYVGQNSSGFSLDVFSNLLVRLCVTGRNLYSDGNNVQDAEQLFAKTRSVFEEALAIVPDNADMYREFATMYIKTNTKLGKAQKLAGKAVDLGGTAENYYVLGYAYSRESNWNKSISAFERAMELDPKNMRYKQAYDLVKRKRAKR